MKKETRKETHYFKHFNSINISVIKEFVLNFI